jgi:two-component system chemotaxis response regulator CheY
MRSVMRDALSELGFSKIDMAEDGTQALDMISKALIANDPYQLLFLDWNMPDKTGIEVLEHCRSQAVCKDLVIVMVTSEAESKNVIRALKAGADDYIVKPCSPAVLRAKVDHINKRLAGKKAK